MKVESSHLKDLGSWFRGFFAIWWLSEYGLPLDLVW
jgi:hypothetical protein